MSGTNSTVIYSWDTFSWNHDCLFKTLYFSIQQKYQGELEHTGQACFFNLNFYCLLTVVVHLLANSSFQPHMPYWKYRKQKPSSSRVFSAFYSSKHLSLVVMLFLLDHLKLPATCFFFHNLSNSPLLFTSRKSRCLW